MPPRKAFDPDKKVDEAMDLFWRRGFEATTMEQLVEHLNISRGSLYDTYGSKDGLWRLALERYGQLHGGDVLIALAAGGPVLPGIRALLERLADLDVADRRGCMVVNAAMARAPDDPETTRRVVTQLARIEEAMYAALRRAQDSGEVSPDRDARALARFLLASLQGIRVLGKATGDRRALQDVIAVTIASLVTPAPTA